MRIRRGKAGPEPEAESDADLSVGATLAGVRRFVDVTIPRTSIRARMRLLTRREEREMAIGLEGWLRDGAATEATGRMPLSGETCHRTLAVALRRLDADEPLASYDVLDEADDAQLGELWDRYQALVAELDPEVVELDDATRALIDAALKKKDPLLLRSFGTKLLSSYLLTTADPPAS